MGLIYKTHKVSKTNVCCQFSTLALNMEYGALAARFIKPGGVCGDCHKNQI